VLHSGASGVCTRDGAASTECVESAAFEAQLSRNPNRGN
jgi:hypothetical protein